MNRLRQFKDKMQVSLDFKALKKMEKKELFEEQKKQEDSKYNVFYINGNFNEYYREIEILGEGCVGLVKKVERVSDGKIFASKMVKTKDEEEVVLNVIREFKNLRELHHPNIVKVYELYVDETKGRIYTIMELVEAKEMFDVISNLGQYSESVAISIFKQILAAIDYLHENMVCHRDLKPNNILCNEDGTCVKITDFNVSKFAHYDNAHKKASTIEGRKQVLMWTYTGTVAYSAPEIFDGDSYDESVDMWSAGAVLYTMLAGYQPFEEEYVQDLITKIKNSDYTFPKNISENAQDLIKKCLQVDPEKRIKPTEALTHPWILNKQNNTQPLNEVANRLNLNITKLISKFSAYRNLGLIRKTTKRKQTFCPSMLYKIRESPPRPLGIGFFNEEDEGDIRKELCNLSITNFNQLEKQSQQSSTQQFLIHNSSTYVEQTSGYNEQSNQNRFAFAQNQNNQVQNSQKHINTGFNVLENIDSQPTSSSEIQSTHNNDDENYTISPDKSLICQNRGTKNSQQIELKGMRKRKQAHTNIIHNRYKLNESDQFIVQAMEDDQISNNDLSQTTQDLSESDQILCYKIYNKLNPDSLPSKNRVNSLCEIQTERLSPPRLIQHNSLINTQWQKLNMNSCLQQLNKNTVSNCFQTALKSRFANIFNLNEFNCDSKLISYQSLSDSQIKTFKNIKLRESIKDEQLESKKMLVIKNIKPQDTSIDAIV
ncbi:hypothetical protein ABPG72_003313 [Tetrahymena utriculariae]